MNEQITTEQEILAECQALRDLHEGSTKAIDHFAARELAEKTNAAAARDAATAVSQERVGRFQKRSNALRYAQLMDEAKTLDSLAERHSEHILDDEVVQMDALENAGRHFQDNSEIYIDAAITEATNEAGLDIDYGGKHYPAVRPDSSSKESQK